MVLRLDSGEDLGVSQSEDSAELQGWSFIVGQGCEVWRRYHLECVRELSGRGS
jgi:hypothetical protein